MSHCSKNLNRRNLKHICSQLFQIHPEHYNFKSNNSKLNAFSLSRMEYSDVHFICFVSISLEPVDVDLSMRVPSVSVKTLKLHMLIICLHIS